MPIQGVLPKDSPGAPDFLRSGFRPGYGCFRKVRARFAIFVWNELRLRRQIIWFVRKRTALHSRLCRCVTGRRLKFHALPNRIVDERKRQFSKPAPPSKINPNPLFPFVRGLFYTHDLWPYFRHVPPEPMQGFVLVL